MKTTILIFDSSNNTGSPYIDRFGDSWNCSTYHEATGFESVEEAKTFIEKNEWDEFMSVSEIDFPETIEEMEAQS